MPKFFVISDIHSFYEPMIEALNNVGFNPTDENHWLISCGDVWDRGPDTVRVMKYLTSLPRKILIHGNHDQLFEDLCCRGYPYSYDRSNGTVRTVYQLGRSDDFEQACEIALNRARPFLNSMVNYYETNHYIFVHSWIPLINKDGLPAHYIKDRKFEFNPDWRNASQEEWNWAMWGNPFDLVEQGLLPDKVIVFGHWHCSTGWAKSEGRSEFDENARFDPYYGDGFIAIDACTAYSGKCNVIVLEDDFLEGNDNV